MENVILSDEQLEELSDGMQKIYKEEVSLDYNFIYDGMLMKAEARHLLRILKERYTCGNKDDMAKGWIMISPVSIHAPVWGAT